jgi:hypothetical protein
LTYPEKYFKVRIKLIKEKQSRNCWCDWME